MRPDDPTLKVRFPRQTKDWLDAEAAKNHRSRTAEVVFCVEEVMRLRAQSEPAAGQASQA